MESPPFMGCSSWMTAPLRAAGDRQSGPVTREKQPEIERYSARYGAFLDEMRADVEELRTTRVLSRPMRRPADLIPPRTSSDCLRRRSRRYCSRAKGVTRARMVRVDAPVQSGSHAPAIAFSLMVGVPSSPSGFVVA